MAGRVNRKFYYLFFEPFPYRDKISINLLLSQVGLGHFDCMVIIFGSMLFGNKEFLRVF